MSTNFYRGVDQSRDARFSDKSQKLLKTMSFPATYSTPVDLSKVNLTVLRPWIQSKLTEIMGFDDDVVQSFLLNELEQGQKKATQVGSTFPKELHISMTGFLELKTSSFMTELWEMLISASKRPDGVPQELLDAKISEIQQLQTVRFRTPSPDFLPHFPPPIPSHLLLHPFSPLGSFFFDYHDFEI